MFQILTLTLFSSLLRFLRKTFRSFFLQIGLASLILMKLLYREKWESVPKGPIVSFGMGGGRRWTDPSLDNRGKNTYSVVTLIAMGLSAALGIAVICVCHMYPVSTAHVLLVMPE